MSPAADVAVACVAESLELLLRSAGSWYRYDELGLDQMQKVRGAQQSQAQGRAEVAQNRLRRASWCVSTL